MASATMLVQVITTSIQQALVGADVRDVGAQLIWQGHRNCAASGGFRGSGLARLCVRL